MGPIAARPLEKDAHIIAVSLRQLTPFSHIVCIACFLRP